MQWRTPTRLLTTWIAALAILVAALLPTLSHALGATFAASWVEVCTSAGAKFIAADAAPGADTPAPADTHPFAHCPYCVLHAHALGLPPTAAVVVPVVLDHGQHLPAAFLAAPRTLHAWVSAQPRAPPLFC